MPLPEGTIVAGTGFHAALSDGEGYSNAPWTSQITETEITFATIDNPIRWGTLYNFWFDADRPPARSDVTVGLYEPGTPSSLSVSVANAPAPDCNGNNVPDGNDIAGGAPDGNANGVPDECETAVPTIAAAGSRYLSLQLAGVADVVALYLTGDAQDPAVSCVTAYVQADGTLGPEPVFQNITAWEGVPHITGEQILPGATYGLQADFGSPGAPILGPVTSAATWMWGDVDNNGVVNFADISLVVRGFQGDFSLAAREAVDLHPCTPNGDINFADINWDVTAFQGAAYLDTECPVPCP